MTDELFREDATLTTCEARITCIDERGVQLERTIFYPLGGGQAGDRGALILPDGGDLTYELSGNPQSLNLAIDLTGDFGRVVIGSWYGRRPVEVDLGGRIHRAQLQLIGSEVSHLAPGRRGRWTKAPRLAVAWALLPRHRPERLITHRLPLRRAAEAYRLLDEQPEEAMQIVFEY